MSKPHKIMIKDLKNEKERYFVRCGNEYFYTSNIIIFIQLTADAHGEWHGFGVVEPYGKDTLVLRIN